MISKKFFVISSLCLIMFAHPAAFNEEPKGKIIADHNGLGIPTQWFESTEYLQTTQKKELEKFSEAITFQPALSQKELQQERRVITVNTDTAKMIQVLLLVAGDKERAQMLKSFSTKRITPLSIDTLLEGFISNTDSPLKSIPFFVALFTFYSARHCVRREECPAFTVEVANSAKKIHLTSKSYSPAREYFINSDLIKINCKTLINQDLNGKPLIKAIGLLKDADSQRARSEAIKAFKECTAEEALISVDMSKLSDSFTRRYLKHDESCSIL